MNNDFWISRWTKEQTGWHMSEVHPKLKKYWPDLDLGEETVILVPFCGKSLDLRWLAERHQRVIGVELVEKPVKAFMNEHFDAYQTRNQQLFNIYKAGNLEIWNGDFFNLSANMLPSIDGIYDRGSLVSLPPAMRKKYCRKMCRLAGSNTRILLIAFDYNQEEMNGPPFSVPPEEVEKHFGSEFKINQLLNQSIIDDVEGFRQQGLSTYMHLNVYRLDPR